MGTPDDPTETGGWASNPVGDLAIETLHKGLIVGLIATKRTDFVTCVEDEMLETVVERTRRHRFDYLPVTEHTAGGANTYERIVGLIEFASFMNGAKASGLIRDWMQRLSDENLIGADASILTFVRDADRQRCRLIVAGHEISGLVSLADLQRLPVRAALERLAAASG
jgi:CBS domain-containing protein